MNEAMKARDTLISMEKRFYRRINKEKLDYYPTPPWVTRALFRYVLGDFVYLNNTCWEPACGNGHMSEVLTEQFKYVWSSDIVYYDYFPAGLTDFLNDDAPTPYQKDGIDWIITNPPFNLAEEFILKALVRAKVGVAMFCRLQLLEGQHRYNHLFKDNPPWVVAPFVERANIHKAKVERKTTSTIPFAWFVWDKTRSTKLGTKLCWIPPCKSLLEKDSDYDKRDDDK